MSTTHLMRPSRPRADSLSGLLAGALAGAAGTTALNAVTYLDMAVRGRPTSSTPQDTVEKLSDMTGVEVPGEGEQKENRIAGLAPLMGIGTGVAVGALAGLARAQGRRLPPGLDALAIGAVALVGANGPMAALGISDPRSWSASEWVSDVVPHAAYGWVTAAVLSRFPGVA